MSTSGPKRPKITADYCRSLAAGSERAVSMAEFLLEKCASDARALGAMQCAQPIPADMIRDPKLTDDVISVIDGRGFDFVVYDGKILIRWADERKD